MQGFINILKACSDITRMRILILCSMADLTVSDICNILCQSQPRVSRHMKILSNAGILVRLQEGNWAFWRLPDTGKFVKIIRTIVDLTPKDTPELLADATRLEAIRKKRIDLAGKYFRKNAARWNEIRSIYVDEKAIEKKLLDLLKSVKLGKLIDIGTGTGRLLELLAKKSDYAVGIDISRKMLAIARVNMDNLNIRNVELRQADMYSTPYANDYFSTVILYMVLHHSATPYNVLLEAKRIMKPNGNIFLVDFLPHNKKELQTEHAHQYMGFSTESIQYYADELGLKLLVVNKVISTSLEVAIWQLTIK